MRGRPPKPLALKIAEGQRLSQSSSGINYDAPEPPRGPLDPPADLSNAQAVVWKHVIANQAPGVFRPIDTGTLRQYCWFYSELLGAQAELRKWGESKKKRGETSFLRRARNGALVAHQLFNVIKDLGSHVIKLECLLGLNPVSRERIHAGVQGELFSDAEKSTGTGWVDLDVMPGEKPQ